MEKMAHFVRERIAEHLINAHKNIQRRQVAVFCKGSEDFARRLSEKLNFDFEDIKLLTLGTD